LLAKLDRQHRDSAGQQPAGHPAAPRAGHSSPHSSPTKLPTTGEHYVALLIIAAASTLLLALLSYTPRPRTSPGGRYLPDPHSTARALDRPAPGRGRFKRVDLSPRVVASWRSVGGAVVAPTGASAGTVTQGLPAGRRLSVAERAVARSEEHGSVALKRLVSFLRVQARIRSSVYAIAPEPKRDWTLARFVTGHRLEVLACMTLVTIGLYSLQELLWPHAQGPRGLLQQVWSWGSLLWLGAVVPGTLGLLGMLSYVHSRRMDWVQPIDKLVAFRIVSRGTNIDALVATIRRCQSEMAKTPLFPYLIEVVTDTSFVDVLPPNEDITYIIVPSDYRTPRGSLYKARALHYALQESEIPDDAWIVHLDEETQPTSSGIKGICAMIREEEESGRLRVGQGAILYHRTWRKHPFLTLADNVRTGDDFARFHFQHKLGVTVFGLHGSYIVVRNDLEKSIGFDFGPVGSITEDAFWALVAMQAGHRCRWVDGYLEEQSTQSIGDFVRQRRRWWQGLAKVALHAPVRFRWRVCIGTNTLLWALAPFAALYTVGHMFYGFEVRPPVHLLANLSFASFATLYLIGLKANLDEYGVQNPLRRAGWAIAQLVLLPAFTFMEGIGVLSAIVKPVSGFHVVKK
jgi:egghead protein (zeste-white 4 protein)